MRKRKRRSTEVTPITSLSTTKEREKERTQDFAQKYGRYVNYNPPCVHCAQTGKNARNTNKAHTQKRAAQSCQITITPLSERAKHRANEEKDKQRKNKAPSANRVRVRIPSKRVQVWGERVRVSRGQKRTQALRNTQAQRRDE